MTRAVSFQELAKVEPRLAELEARARAVKDTDKSRFFCSNFIWLPMYTSLRTLIGAYRSAVPGEPERVEGDLRYDGEAFEVAYLHLSRLLPPCRDCGCTTFEPVREAQLGRPEA